MPVVQVRVSRADFADILGVMRDWLARQARPLMRFEAEADDDTIIIKTQFDAGDLAEAFRQEFGGDYAG